MVVDPRPIASLRFSLEVYVQGTELTVTKTFRPFWDPTPGWIVYIPFRIYSRNEIRYRFDSRTYLLHGLRYEYAPLDVTEVFVKYGIETIREREFCDRRALRNVRMPETVRIIETNAFFRCLSLPYLELPTNLTRIADNVFSFSALYAIYIPPTVTEIGFCAFRNCKSLRIINFPDRVHFLPLYVVIGCDDLLPDEMQAQSHNYNDNICHWLWTRYNSFHNLCWDPTVTADRIQEYMREHRDEARARTNDKPQFTPLHLLAANPSVDGEKIATYLTSAPYVAVMQDNLGMTPLHMLCSNLYSLRASQDAIRAYLSFEEGRAAAFMVDHEGKSPLDRLLYEKRFEESFGSMMLLWFTCFGVDFRVYEYD